MAVRPAVGETIKETKFTELLPAEERGERTRLPELWDFVETLPQTTDPSNPDYQFTLYRGTKAQKSEEKEWLGKFHERMTREKIQSMFGGGLFNVWLKLRVGKGNALELKYNEDLKIGGEPLRTPAVIGGPSSAASNDPLLRLVDVMDRRMAAMEAKFDVLSGGGAAAEAVRQAVVLNGEVFRSAMPAVTSTLQGIANPGGQSNSLADKILAVAIDRLLAPPAAPTPATNSVKDTLEMITALKGAGIFAPSDGKAGIALELVRQVPNVASTLVQGISQWRMAEESRERQIAMTRGANPNPPIPVTPVNHPPATVIQMPTPGASPAETQANGNPPPAPPVSVEVPQMPIETLEQMLCNIIVDPGLTIDQAANEACALIERSMPGMTDKMISQGEEWLLGLFQQRPVLQQVANHPRLPEFVKKFIEVVKAAPIMQPPNPAAPVA
jgi:hypothetical protein